jgi:hypothetical protein
MLLALAFLAVAARQVFSGTPSASGQAGGPGEVTAQTDDSVPAHRVTMFGASPQEAAGETWGLGRREGASILVRYTSAGGWTLGGNLLDESAQPLSGFKLDQPEAGLYAFPNPQAGQMTASGSGVLAGTVAAKQVLLTRDPGGSFKETAPVPESGEAALEPNELMLGVNRPPILAALDEPNTEGGGVHAGALVVPVNEESGEEHRVLHWNGESWTSETIEVPVASREEFQVLAIGASSPENAWLLARLSVSAGAGAVALFRRHAGGGGEPATWQPVATTSSGEPGEPLRIEEALMSVPDKYQSQILDVTDEGVWVNGIRADINAPATLFFKPESETSGSVLDWWCKVPSGAGNPEGCAGHELPQGFTSARIRSFAWDDPSNPSRLGQRVITGLPGGQTMRLEGTEFATVRSLGGGSARSESDVGGTFGSAFSNPREGWLGQQTLPVHLTVTPSASRLSPWPTAFSHTLLAAAPQPGATVGAASSQALAVGEDGEVARYSPEQGWLPESLFGPGGRHETPTLRAVAWPRTGRAYAVGDEGEMWLWRGETGLWEADPAAPVNFRGNMLGIAFDPSEPQTGYAVGQGGVLLSYGKSWEQVPEASAADPGGLPAKVVGANFTSVAFAGSEAIVAYDRHVPSTEDFEGGLIVNDGSGWHIDEAAAAVIGSEAPWAVAGLPDGGAAFTTLRAGRILERESAGGAWQETPVPYPSGLSPGSIAAFREGTAIRVVAVGSVPVAGIVEDEDQASPPAGFPPNFIKPYPIASNQEQGVLRQTAGGWSDEEHELDNIREPEGGYARYDTVYQPDPVAAVLIDGTDSHGWAVGGIADGENVEMDTSDVWRYPTDGTPPVGTSTAPISSSPESAVFAIGGGAHCEAPCADRVNARIGPDVWLRNAMADAAKVPNMRGFFYTGPRVTTGATVGPAEQAVPYAQEFGEYAQLLKESPLPAFATSSPTDLDLSHSQETFLGAFGGFPGSFGVSASQGADKVVSQAPAPASYYAVESTGAGPAVRVIMLDDSSPELGGAQLSWLEGQLAEAPRPTIVIGNSPLPALVAAGNAEAKTLAALLADRHVAAYFYDSPEQNLQQTLEHLECPKAPAGQSQPATCPEAASGLTLETIGSGTLGYVNFNNQRRSGFVGMSGFLLVQIDKAGAVSVKLVPNVGELGLEASDGTLLRRSQVASFQALARRPRSGNDAANGSTAQLTNPYIPIPSICAVGVQCSERVKPEYTFTSSNEEVGQFVEPNAASSDAKAVKLGANKKPIPDAESGLFCAYNKGETTVTVTAGGHATSLHVVVQAGSPRQPCGTVPIKNQSSRVEPNAPPPPLKTEPSEPPPATAPPVVPPLPTPSVVTHPAPSPQSFFSNGALPAFIPAFVPPPVPTPARPTPPSGTSAVTSPVEAPEKEEEQEAAPETSRADATAYVPTEHEPDAAYLLGLLVLAAFAGAGVRRRPRGGRKPIKVAPATINTIRSQRRNAPRDR